VTVGQQGPDNAAADEASGASDQHAHKHDIILILIIKLLIIRGNLKMTEQGLPPSMRDRVPFLLYRAAEHSHALANDMLARIELTARQAGILTLVTEREPMTQKALTDLLGIDRTTMVALIDDLEQKGLVERRRHPRDRRAFLISPTEPGEAAKVRAIEILDEQQRHFLAPLTRAEQQQLGSLLKRLQQPPRDGLNRP